MTKLRIAFLNGSLRKDSFHGRLGLAIAAAAKDRLELVTPSLDLPLYNQDLEGAATPEAWTRFRDDIRPLDGVLFGSPEYNRSMTGALKNAIDVGSRPYGKSVFSKKPAAVFSASPGLTGGFGSNHAVRQSCVFLDMPVMQQPEAYWGTISDDKLGNDGTIHDEALAKFVERLRHRPRRLGRPHPPRPFEAQREPGLSKAISGLADRAGRGASCPLQQREDKSMRSVIFSAVALALVSISPANAAAPCREKGKFVKCKTTVVKTTTRCKSANGKFAKCGTPGAKPV